MIPLKKFLIPTIALISLISCEKIVYFETTSEFSASSLALVHAASGNSDYEGQTLDAVIFGFGILDGIEVDIQQSKEGTLWLSHDTKVFSASGNELGYFSYTSDNEIEEIMSEDSTFYYTRLEEVFEYMHAHSINKHISLDVKRPIEVLTYSDYKDMANQIMELAEKYKLYSQVLIESGSSYFLSRFNGNKQAIETYYFCMGDFDKGVAEAQFNKLTGISFKYNSKDDVNQELIDLLHSTGLKMQIFYINEPADIQELYNYGIDFLQTDNHNFYEYN